MNAQTVINDAEIFLNYLAIAVAVAAFLMAKLPQGKSGSMWDKIRTNVNLVAMNWGHAKNVIEKLDEAEKSSD